MCQKNQAKLGYFCSIADVGQTPMQARQSMQIDSSHSAFPSASNDRAPVGHTPTQAPHPIQVSFVTNTGIKLPPSFIRVNYSKLSLHFNANVGLICIL